MRQYDLLRGTWRGWWNGYVMVLTSSGRMLMSLLGRKRAPTNISTLFPAITCIDDTLLALILGRYLGQQEDRRGTPDCRLPFHSAAFVGGAPAAAGCRGVAISKRHRGVLGDFGR